MTLSEASKLFLAGGRLLVGEYRSSKAENITWRDKQSGKPMHAATLRHIVECGGDSVVVSDYLPDGQTAEGYKPPFTKGQPVIISVTSIQVDKGLVSCRGQMSALEK